MIKKGLWKTATLAGLWATLPLFVQAASFTWSGDFDPGWKERWGVIHDRAWWGERNMDVVVEKNGKFKKFFRVGYPAGSASPSVSREHGAPVGGCGFYADLGIKPCDALKLSYHVRFARDFDFVKGGKLPGLFGGTVMSGGHIPDGTNGFSTRYMWRAKGDGEMYAYLPTSKVWGTSLGRGDWRFKKGAWQHLEQTVTLNHAGKDDGSIKVCVDGKLVLDQQGLNFRTVEGLKIEGIMFDTFFGGGDVSWASKQDNHIDFADFSVESVDFK